MICKVLIGLASDVIICESFSLFQVQMMLELYSVHNICKVVRYCFTLSI